jgi:hypothetical protein
MIAMLATCFNGGFLLGLFFDPEEVGDMFLLKFCWFAVDNTALYPRS